MPKYSANIVFSEKKIKGFNPLFSQKGHNLVIFGHLRGVYPNIPSKMGFYRWILKNDQKSSILGNFDYARAVIFLNVNLSHREITQGFIEMRFSQKRVHQSSRFFASIFVLIKVIYKQNLSKNESWEHRPHFKGLQNRQWTLYFWYNNI